MRAIAYMLLHAKKRKSLNFVNTFSSPDSPIASLKACKCIDIHDPQAYLSWLLYVVTRVES